MKRTLESTRISVSIFCLLAGLAACSTPQQAKQAPPAAYTPIVAVNAVTQNSDTLPAYQRAAKLERTIRLAGSAAVATFACT